MRDANQSAAMLFTRWELKAGIAPQPAVLRSTVRISATLAHAPFDLQQVKCVCPKTQDHSGSDDLEKQLVNRPAEFPLGTLLFVGLAASAPHKQRIGGENLCWILAKPVEDELHIPVEW